ncbi:DoxX-like family protein [Pseudomonas asturiensis]|uniref:DoxX-like family protein n=2 Tax=Pseudomonas asturiensis TaxID=1190415 RepID=A0A1M7N673_9PSED|nr:DoxX-like family protein [Pseudomonas asturiensis]
MLTAVGPPLTYRGLVMAVYLYWVSTALLSLLYFASAYLYITQQDYVRQAQAELGYSASCLVPFMIVVKVLGPVLILSRFNVALSDLAYAGIFYHLILSGMAHLNVRKPKGAIPAVLGLLFLATSFMTQNDARQLASPYASASSFLQTSVSP